MTTLSAYLQTWRLKLSNTKTVTAVFYLNNREAKRELNVYNYCNLLRPCPVPTYLGVKLDRSLTSHTNGGLACPRVIQPPELRRLGATLSLANRAIHDPDHVLHRQLVGQQDAHLGRLRSRRPFVPAAWKLLGSLSKLDIRVKQWTKHKWNANYLESTSRVRAFLLRVSSRPLGMSLPRTSWVRLNRLRTGEGRFHSSMYKWGLAPSLNCECGATEQTADHIISSCLIHHVPRVTRGLQVLDDATQCRLNPLRITRF